MGISSAMNAGVMGLNVNSSKLSTISDNIANSETKGYKRSMMEFSSLVLTERPTSYDAGGVRAATVRDVEEQGALLSTRNVMDLAISGRGFLPVTDITAIKRGDATLPQMLTRTGSFRPDENGVMRTTSGYALMGWKAVDGAFPDGVARESATDLSPINISDVALAAEPTKQITLGANLDARLTGQRATPAPKPFPISVEYFDVLGGAEKLDIRFTPDNAVANNWTMGVYLPGSAAPVGFFSLRFASETLPIDAPGGPLQAGYLESVIASGAPETDPVSGALLYIDPTDPDLRTTTQINPVAYYSGGAPTDDAATGLRLYSDGEGGFTTSDTATTPPIPLFYDVLLVPPVTETDTGVEAFDDGSGAATSDASLTGLKVYDGGGGALSFSDDDPPLFMAPNDTDTTLTQINALATGILGANGGVWHPEDGEIAVKLSDGLERRIRLGELGMQGDLSQFKAESQPSNITKDGSPVSEIVGLEISEAGIMDAIFGSGFRKSIYKIPIGNVQNPNGLNALDGQVFTLSRESGSVYYYDAGDGPTGRLVSSALEESTTDLAEELTQLIKTQRAYSSNAKIIQTVDEMLQETTNLKR
ncbi:MAG: flagellar hook protein FlgE [Rubrimonas sp.]